MKSNSKEQHCMSQGGSNAGCGEPQSQLNFDVRTYHFQDLDLEMAVSHLPRRDQNILVLYLMGYTQADISEMFSVSRSMVSKRMRMIIGKLTRWLAEE